MTEVLFAQLPREGRVATVHFGGEIDLANHVID
jgi:hypothetical protein